MKLLTKEITKKATEQFDKGSDMEQMIVAKYFDKGGDWQWFLMNMEDENYCWGIVKGFEVEMGSFSLTELEEVLGRRLERDLYFEQVKAKDLWKQLNNGEFV